MCICYVYIIYLHIGGKSHDHYATFVFEQIERLTWQTIIDGDVDTTKLGIDLHQQHRKQLAVCSLDAFCGNTLSQYSIFSL